MRTCSMRESGTPGRGEDWERLVQEIAAGRGGQGGQKRGGWQAKNRWAGKRRGAGGRSV
jgi:hypothetical protein